jgi:hypothetical protein
VRVGRERGNTWEWETNMRASSLPVRPWPCAC